MNNCTLRINAGLNQNVIKDTTSLVSSSISIRKTKFCWDLPRLQLSEFCDQPWVSGTTRSAYLDCLSTLFRLSGMYKKISPIFSSWTKDSGNKAVLDIASGAGSPVDILIEENKKKNLRLPKIFLSDLFPNIKEWESLERKHGGDALGSIKESFNIIEKTLEFENYSICCAFHHFDPKSAKEILNAFAKNGKSLFVLEVLSRKWLNLIAQLFATIPLVLVMAVATPFFSGKLNFKKLLITTIFPLVPLMVALDGIVSLLRTYNKEEILGLLPEDISKSFSFEYRDVKYAGIFKGSYWIVKAK